MCLPPPSLHGPKHCCPPIDCCSQTRPCTPPQRARSPPSALLLSKSRCSLQLSCASETRSASREERKRRRRRKGERSDPLQKPGKKGEKGRREGGGGRESAGFQCHKISCPGWLHLLGIVEEVRRFLNTKQAGIVICDIPSAALLKCRRTICCYSNFPRMRNEGKSRFLQ